MDWCRLTAGYYRDPAVAQAGEAAEILFVRMLAYCAEKETGGRVPRAVLPFIAPTKHRERVDALLREGLLVADGDDLILRSWARIQEAHDTEADRRRKDRERKAAKRLAERAALDDCLASSADLSVDSSAEVPRTVPTESARIEVEVEKDQKSSTSGTRKRSPRATSAPDIFPITPEMAAWGRENCPLITDPVRETADFLDHARANGKTFTDWTAGWRTWMRRAQKYAVRAPGNVRTFPSKQAPPGSDPHRAHLWEQR